MLKIKGNFISNLVLWLIICTCFSYPISAVIIAYFQVPSGPINISLKILYAIIACIIILLITIKNGLRFPKIILSGLFFFGIYSIRLLYDIFIEDVQVLLYSSSYVLSYYFGATLLPIIAIILGYKYLNVHKLSIFVFWTIVIANIFIIYYLLVLSDFGDLEKQLAMRAHIKTEGVKIGTLINPITIGYYGAALALFCINAFLIDLFSSRIIKLLLFPLLILGLTILLLGASRGPLLGFILVLVISLIAKFIMSKEKTIALGKFSLFLILGYSLFYGAISQLTKKYDIFLLYRVEKFFTDRDMGRKEVRDYSFESAWNDFLSSPIIGNQFVGTFDNFYPHNIFLEVLMATGVLGGIFFLLFFYRFSVNSFSLITQRRFTSYTPFVFTCLICFFLSATSGSIFGSPEIWILMTVTTLLIKV